MPSTQTSSSPTTTTQMKDQGDGKRQQDPFLAGKPAAWKSLVAGATAGAIEGAATYPFEYAKTMLQFAPERSKGVVRTPDGVVIPAQSRNPITLIVTTARTKGVSALYVGCSSLIVGTALKASVRFLAFDSIKGVLVDENGKLSGARGVLAGMGAGVLESVLAVTPFETIKTALIEDGKRAKPEYRGLVHGSVSLFRGRGIAGVYRGVVAVTLRQGANSAVRMGSYSWLKGLVQSRQTNTNAPLGSGMTFGIGAIAGIITVYTTMPFDTVKTRMQSLSAKTEYTSTIDCARKTFNNEGLKAFWSGSTARLGRLIFSGGIVFTVYEAVMDVLRPL